MFLTDLSPRHLICGRRVLVFDPGCTGSNPLMTKAQAASLRVKWREEEDRPCRHLHLELEHNNNDYLTDNYHCTACGELVAANTRDPFQVI